MDKNKPSIRFKGFTDDWKQCQLKEIVNYISSSLSAKDITNDGKYKLFDANGIIGYTNTKPIREKYITIIKDGSGVGRTKLLSQNTVFISTMGGILAKDNIDINFLFCCMKKIDFNNYINGAAIPHIYFSNYGGALIYITSLDEQKKIGVFLKKLDNLILTYNHKCEKLKDIKKAMLEKMFPKEDSYIPEIRFKGFIGVWEQRQLGEIYEKVNEKNDLRYGTNKIISVANMYFKSEVYISDKEYLKTYNIFKLGDIAFEGHKSKDFSYGRFVENTIGDGIVSHVFDVFRPKVEFDLQFWKYAINNECIMKSILMRCTKASIMMTNLVAVDFFKENFKIPLLNEQKKVGKFFKYLDSLINLYQHKLKKLKNIKKAMLEKMFV